jgi:PAS domain S-box-containing protein
MSDVADAARDEGERFFRELADNAPVMIWRSGSDALCDWFNTPWLDFVGRTLEQEVGNGWSEGVHPDDFAACLETYLSAFEARRSFTMMYRLRRADGAYRQIVDNGRPFHRNGGFAGYFGSCIDVTEQLAVEAQLRQAQKAEAIGQFTGGVAHDFNNLLQLIGGNLQLLSKDLPDDERVRRRLRHAMDGVSRGSKLTSQMLAFARRQALRPRVVNIGRLIPQAADMLRMALGEGVEVKTVTAHGLWNTIVDPVQLETAILNLALNARDAMAGRGKLTIEIGAATPDSLTGAADINPAARPYVRVSVTDTGCGMPPETVERAFDPFFTTKGAASGTGLGLSMVHGLVKQSGGHIWIDSEVGRGTTVHIFLPRALESEDVQEEPALGDVARGSETILLVEDDDGVRATTADMLAELGYAVLDACDADRAMAIVESGAALDLLFTDVVLPGEIRSTELARKARDLLPGIAVVFTSGYSYNELVRDDALVDGTELLGKPYTREDLDLMLRRALAARAPSASRAPRAHQSV